MECAGPSQGSVLMEQEKELALRASQRDAEAFACLYDFYVDRIYKYVYYKVGNVAEAEDLTAQVFLKAWEAIGDYEWRDLPFSAWLFRIARNLVVDYHRAQREMMPIEQPEGRPPLVIQDKEVGPEQALEENMIARRLREAIAQLTEEQQEVIILRFLEGYSSAEVARIMGKRSGAIRGLQFRGLSTLRETFNREKI